MSDSEEEAFASADEGDESKLKLSSDGGNDPGNVRCDAVDESVNEHCGDPSVASAAGVRSEIDAQDKNHIVDAADCVDEELSSLKSDDVVADDWSRGEPSMDKLVPVSKKAHAQQATAVKLAQKEKPARGSARFKQKTGAKKLAQKIEKPNADFEDNTARTNVEVEVEKMRDVAKTEEIPVSSNTTVSEPSFTKSASPEPVEQSIEGHSPRSSINATQDELNDRERSVLEKLTGERQKDEDTGGSWGSWGWGWSSSLISTATSSVSTFKNQVGEGFSTVLETVEATLSVPSPEEMALERAAEDVKEHDVLDEEMRQHSCGSSGDENDGDQVDYTSGGSGGGLFSALSNITSAGKTLVTGSLDVLESLGKKTYDVINETDPGLAKTKSLFRATSDKPNLSQILKEAKQQEEQRLEQEAEYKEARQAHFESLFDDYQGMAHLEALEMLSNESESRVQRLLSSLTGTEMSLVKPELLQLKETFELMDFDDDETDSHDFAELVAESLSSLNIQASPEKLISCHDNTKDSLMEYRQFLSDGDDLLTAKEVNRTAIQYLAELTVKAVEQYHKAGELLLSTKHEHVHLFIERAQSLANLTRTVCNEVGIISTQFTDLLNSPNIVSNDADLLSSYITNIYLEATNSSTYVQDAFRLLLPVLQLAAVEAALDT